MKYEIITKSVENEEIQEEIYIEELCRIIRLSLSEVEKSGQSNNIFESIN